MGKECKEVDIQPESKQKVPWLGDGERFLAHLIGQEVSLGSSVNQVFNGNQSLG